MDGLLEDKEDAAMNANGDLQPEPEFPGLSKPSNTLSSLEVGEAKDGVKLDREQDSPDLPGNHSKEEKSNKNQDSTAVSERSEPATSPKSGWLQILWWVDSSSLSTPKLGLHASVWSSSMLVKLLKEWDVITRHLGVTIVLYRSNCTLQKQLELHLSKLSVLMFTNDTCIETRAALQTCEAPCANCLLIRWLRSIYHFVKDNQIFFRISAAYRTAIAWWGWRSGGMAESSRHGERENLFLANGHQRCGLGTSSRSKAARVRLLLMSHYL